MSNQHLSFIAPDLGEVRSAPAEQALALADSYLGDCGNINGHSDYARARKEQFLHDGCAYLADAATQMALRTGRLHVEVYGNERGLAASGEVCGYFFPASGGSTGLFLCLSEMAMGIAGHLEKLRPRGDRLVVLARWRTRETRPARKYPGQIRSHVIAEGPKRWLDASLDSRELAEQLLNLFAAELGIEPPTF
jgi:hypothetical protein